MGADSRYWQRSGVSRRRLLGATAATGMGLAGAALIGCGGSGGDGGKTNQPSTSNQAAGGAKGPTVKSITGDTWVNREPEATPKMGGTLNWAAGSPVLANLDTLLSTSAMVHNVGGQAYNELIHVTRDPKDRNSPHIMAPDLATSWEVSDPLKMVFKLRQGVKFHNVAPVNGRPFTSEDVKYALMRARDEKTSLHKGTMSAIKSIDTPDPSTVVLNLSSFDPLLFTSLGNQPGWIVPKELVDANKVKELMIGTGPWIFQKWEQDQRVQFKKNPDYFVKGAPFFDELNMLQIANEEARTAAFSSGQTPIYDVPQTHLAQFEGNNKFTVEPYLRVEPRVVFMKASDERFKDERVRRAISLAIDPDVLLKIHGKGLWRGIVSNQHGGWTLSQDDLKSKKYYMRYDLQEAKQLMSAAGHPDGITSGLLYNTSYPQTYQDMVQYLAEQWTKNKVVTTKAYGQEHATMRKNQDEQNYDGMVAGLDGQGAPEAFLIDYRTGGPKNGSGLKDATMDADVNKVLSIVDTKERQTATKAWIDKYLQKVMYKMEFMDLTNYEAWTKDVHNYVAPPPFQYGASFHYAWLGNA